MKLVELLAKELKEWPEGVDVYAQDANGNIFPWVGIPSICGKEWGREYSSEVARVHQGNSWYSGEDKEPCEDHVTANVTKSQWKAEREKMNEPKWIRHRGGKCPVKAGTKVVTRYRDGVVSDWCMTRNQDTDEECLSAIWSHSGGETDIMAYYVEETKDQEIEEVKDTNIGTLSITLDANDVFKPMIASMKEMALEWGQIESPLKWRDEIIELEAYEEEFRREREKLIRKLESEGFKLIDHMAPVYGEALIDMSDWRNWQAGDIVECITVSDNGQFTFGARYAVKSVNRSSVHIVEDDRGSNTNGWGASNFKFSSRP